MKSLTEKPAVLSVHEGATGQYIVRVSDLKHRPLVVGVTKLLTDAQSFVVITPNDIKVFAAESNGVPETVDPDTQAAIDFEEGRTVPGEVAEVVEEEPPVPPKARKRQKPESVAGHDEACGRCSGQGRVAIALENGTAGETACPVCRGSGIMKRYGARR